MYTGGDAAAGLACLAKGQQHDPPAYIELKRRLTRPTPRVHEGIDLRGIATSAIDLSDGLMADLGHILSASGVGAQVEVSTLPLSSALLSVADPDSAVRWALTGGDDYELCFTVPPERQHDAANRWAEWQCAVTPIGVVDDSKGLKCKLRNGDEYRPTKTGFRHFS